MSLPLGASPRVARDYRQFGQSPLSQPFQGSSAAAMAQAGKSFYLNSLKITLVFSYHLGSGFGSENENSILVCEHLIERIDTEVYIFKHCLYCIN